MTPEGRNGDIARLDGRIDTLDAKVDGELKSQSQNIKAIAGYVRAITHTVKAFDNKFSSYHKRHFERGDQHGKAIAGMEARLDGHERLCEERDRNINTQIRQMKSSLEASMKSGFDSLKELRAREAAEKKERTTGWRWRITTWIALAGIALPLLGWVLARVVGG